MRRIIVKLGERLGRLGARTAALIQSAARWLVPRVRALVRALRLDAGVRWYGEHRVARQWTVNLAGAAFLVWFAGVAKNWIQPTLTPDMLFSSVTIGPEAVRVTEAQPGSVARVATYTGAVQPWEENVVYARVDGYVDQLLVYPGDYVRRGALLATLETSRLNPQLAEAVADSGWWAAEYRRDSLLFSEQAISASELDRARTRFEVAAAKVAMQRTQIGYAAIRALTNGWIAERMVYPGQYVSAGQPVLKVDDLQRVRIQFNVAEEHLSQIQPGTEVYLRFPQLDPERVVATWLTPGGRDLARTTGGGNGDASRSERAEAAARDAPPSGNRVARQAVAVPAKLAVVFPAQDPGTRTGVAEVRLPNPGLVLRANTYVVGDFVVQEGSRGVRVPVSALTPMPGGKTVVFVLPPIVEQGAVEEREVVVGVRNSEWVELLSGVRPGERVVYQGNRNLVNGQPVMVLNPQGSF